MDMDNVSKMLKEARLAKGLSLEEAEAATSIRKLYLDAVEKGEFDKIPGDVFTKGIIRTYGNFLGLNGPDLVNIYKAQNSGLTKEAVAPKPIRMVEKISISPQIKPERVSSGNWLSYIVVLALVIVVAGGIAWFMNTDSSQNLVSEPAAVENSMPAEEKAACPDTPRCRAGHHDDCLLSQHEKRQYRAWHGVPSALRQRNDHRYALRAAVPALCTRVLSGQPRTG